MPRINSNQGLKTDPTIQIIIKKLFSNQLLYILGCEPEYYSPLNDANGLVTCSFEIILLLNKKALLTTFISTSYGGFLLVQGFVRIDRVIWV